MAVRYHDLATLRRTEMSLRTTDAATPQSRIVAHLRGESASPTGQIQVTV